MNKTVVRAVLCLAGSAFVGTAFAMLDDAAALKVAREALGRLTLEERTMLLGGSGTMTLPKLEKIGMTREWTMSDNSSTVRPQMNRWSWGYVEPQTANTKLPSLSALAMTWDPAMAALQGRVLGAEMRERGVDQLLGPGVNILRTPLNGRNWEYLGEDPVLAAKLCVPMIRGIQSYDVAATVKHYCLNDQELARNTVDTHADARTLNEIYLPAFRAAIKEADVLSVMTAYNRIDGIWASENKYLQDGILRDRWGFKGFVVTDWGGQHTTDFAANSGGGVEMSRGDNIKYYYHAVSNRFPLAQAVRDGLVPAATVDEMALHTLFTMAKTGFLTGAPRQAGARNTKQHQMAARRIAEESVVLAKNEDGILPLAAKDLHRVVVLGLGADVEQCHRGCSGEGNVPYEITFYRGLTNSFAGRAEVQLLPLPKMLPDEKDAKGVDLSAARRAGGHARGIAPVLPTGDPAAVRVAAEAADAVFVFIGTELGYQGGMESESRDRPSMLPERGVNEAVAEVLGWKLKNLVVVSRSGSPMEYPWADACRTLVLSSYLGMEEGSAIVRVLFGDVNPSGRLAQTWPRAYADTAVAACGTYNATNVTYRERFYVGYRWHDAKKIEPLFPFGFGLSYTTFAYEVQPTNGLAVAVRVTNTGKVAGKEVVQLYAAYPDAKVERCEKELKGFAKVFLKPGESKTVVLRVTERDLAYWDDFHHRFRTDAGAYRLLVGASSRDIRGETTVTVLRDREFAD